MKDRNGKELKVGDTINLFFPYTETTCKIIVASGSREGEIIADSKCQTIYGNYWLECCEKVEVQNSIMIHDIKLIIISTIIILSLISLVMN